MPARYIKEPCLDSLGILFVRECQRLRNTKPMLQFIARPRREKKWCRVSYKVTMLDGGEEFECECGQFAHMGLLCSHVLKVLDFIRAKEIPSKHTVKRWAKDARDILPAHLAQYQKDSMQNNPFSYRHFAMFMHAMELVRLGDTSVEAYNRFIDLFKSNLSVMVPYAETRDGLGLEDRIADGGMVVNQVVVATITGERNNIVQQIVGDLTDNDSVKDKQPFRRAASSSQTERNGAANDK